MLLNNYLYQIVDFLFCQPEQLQQLEIHPKIENGLNFYSLLTELTLQENVRQAFNMNKVNGIEYLHYSPEERLYF